MALMLRCAARSFAALVLGSIAACGLTEPDYSKVKGNERGAAAPQVPPAAAPSQPSAKPTAAAPMPDGMEATPIDLRPPGSEEKPAIEAAAKPPPRNYPAELQAAIGTPVDCLKPRLAGSAPAEVRISLEATVMESGYISRGSASSSQLDPEEVACVKRRVDQARLNPGVEQAPRTVTGSVTLHLKAPPAPAAQAPAAPTPTNTY